jgi:hypothetical protein
MYTVGPVVLKVLEVTINLRREQDDALLILNSFDLMTSRKPFKNIQFIKISCTGAIILNASNIISL